MRPSASQIDADQRRREIELAFAYLCGPALQAQRIAFEILAPTLATAPVGGMPEAPASWLETGDEARPAPPAGLRVGPRLRPRLKSAYGGFESAGAAANPP